MDNSILKIYCNQRIGLLIPLALATARRGLPVFLENTMDKKATLPKLPSHSPVSGHTVQSSQPAQPSTLPPLPSLDRSAQPVPAQQQPTQLTGPQKLDSHEVKLAVQRSMVDSVIPVKLSALLPCGVHPCLNLCNTAQISFDLPFGQYRISIICPECARSPRP